MELTKRERTGRVEKETARLQKDGRKKRTPSLENGCENGSELENTGTPSEEFGSGKKRKI